MKKLLTIIMTGIMTLSLAACSGTTSSDATTTEATTEATTTEETSAETTEAEKTASTVDITHALGTTTVPVNPEKVIVIDNGALDTINYLGFADRVVGISKGIPMDHIINFIEDENVVDLGSLKEIDMEALNSTEPDLIIIGGRQHSSYEDFSAIAPTISASIDNEKGYMESFEANLTNIATIFEKTDEVPAIIDGFNERIEKLKEVGAGKDALVTLVSRGSLNAVGKKSRASIISNEIGFNNIVDIDSTHGDSISFEYVLEKNPDYLFVMDRDNAIGAENAKLAKEVVENDIVKQADVYKNGNIVYLTPTIWYLGEGGVVSTDLMLQDIEKGILK